MPIKLIAIDMDGTLLNSNRQISARNAAAIKAALQKGIIVTIATGRMFAAVQHFALDLGLNVPLIVYNGALIKEAVSGKILGAWPVPQALSNAIVNYCLDRNIYIHAYIQDRLWVYEDCEWARYYADFAQVPFEVHGEELRHLPEGSHKLLCITEQAEQLQKDLEQLYGDKVHLTGSIKDFLEIVALGTSKWQAIARLAAKFHIEKAEIMCIGDSGNDFEMVSNAGIGVAMGNATDKVKDAAKIITAPNDADGVALILEQIMTKQLLVPEV